MMLSLQFDVAAIRCRRGEIVGSLIATIGRFVSSKIAQKLLYTEIHSPVSKQAFGRLDKGLVNTGRCQDDVRRGRELLAERAAEIIERSRPM